ncbi:hypothetical protein ASG31_05155 [Chryseobacterium sp. Leaf404]|uniref:hypothetical protein n=1 Tax=unclassified Chryseobacterium TaxID=2593645 RepID=UPI0006FE7A73|nr:MULTISPECIES: hypothetical protein [unclassified Chryseobacterium]KQT18124.1 hypothetical protein ASG31_05155 [Chryseobacterium sp. Leaf404]
MKNSTKIYSVFTLAFLLAACHPPPRPPRPQPPKRPERPRPPHGMIEKKTTEKIAVFDTSKLSKDI